MHATATPHAPPAPGAAELPPLLPGESPLARLTPEQIEALGRELEAIHEEVMADLGERDAALHPQHDQRPPLARARRPRGCCCSARAGARCGWLGTAALSLAKILENMEIGHNVMHGQWDWMNDPDIHSLQLGVGHGLARRRVAALAQLRAPHLHQHPRQGPRPRLRDHAHRPAAEVAPGLPPAAALQPPADGLLRVGRGAARPQLRRDPLGREAQGARRSPS